MQGFVDLSEKFLLVTEPAGQIVQDLLPLSSFPFGLHYRLEYMTVPVFLAESMVETLAGKTRNSRNPPGN